MLLEHVAEQLNHTVTFLSNINAQENNINLINQSWDVQK